MASKHTTSIVDISEIEDDEQVPLAQHHDHHHNPSHGHAPSAGAQLAPSGHQQPQRAFGSVSPSNQPPTGPQSAQFYLYNEDPFNPQQRIPNVLSTLINSPQPPPVAGAETPSQQQPSNITHPAIDYQPNSSSNNQQLELLNLAAASHHNQQQQQRAGGQSPSGGSEYAYQYGGSAAPDSRATPSSRAGPKAASASRSSSSQRLDGQSGSANVQAKANLGTLSGVYFPCVQNIFGVILFIRMVWIVGTAGVPAAFSLVFICCCVTLTTSISLSAIATNGIVPAGGPYFMISRSLGPECGGAVGTMFFLGTTVAGAMYITGAVEIMLNYLCPSWGLFGDFQRDVNIMYHNIRVYGSLLLILVGLLVWIGVKFVSKLAPIALFCVLLSIFSIYAGIFINYNGRPDLMICVMGDRLVSLKNIPFEDPSHSQMTDPHQYNALIHNQHEHQNSQQSAYSQHRQSGISTTLSNGTGKLSASELATQAQLRRTRALCTFEKLRYIYCPSVVPASETGTSNLGPEQPAANENQPFDQQNNQPDRPGSNQAAGPPNEAQMMAELFKRSPNMSNCDPYFRANKDRIHLEKAVPGIASGVLWENLKPRFRNKRTIVSYDDGINTSPSNDYNQIFVDITTSFTILISIYFPSCTGILAGSNRSGDLTDAQKSIPRGTIAAQLTTSFVYLSCIVLFGSTFNNLFIRDKFGESMGGQLAVTQIAWPHPYVILIGGLLSTLGASLQSLVGAPRVLQGIAKDEVIPAFNRFAKLSPRGEPETAIIFTLFLSWLAVLIGNLDFIAPILTISLVMCYFFINLACTLHSLLGSPNWRPRFKHYHWSISSLGCLLCLFVMIVSSLVYFLVAIFIASCIYKYIEFSGAEKEWGDGKQGLALSAARYNLLRLKTSEPHTKNWRPQLLLFCKLKPASELEPASARVTQQAANSSKLLHNKPSGKPRAPAADASGAEPPAAELRVAHPKLLTFASQLKAGKGLTLVSSILEGDFKELAPIASRARSSLQEAMQEERVKGFADVVVASSIMDGLSYQVQTAGLGGLKHNTVIVGWPEHWRRYASSSTKNHFAAAAATGTGTGTANVNANVNANANSNANANVNANANLQHPSSQANINLASTSSVSPNANQHQRGSFKQNLNTPSNNSRQQQNQTTRAHLFIELMRNVQMSQNAMLVIKGIDSWPESCDKLGGFIDIWWIVNDGGLLMLLPHLLRQHKTWKSCQLRIFTVASPNDNIEQMRQDLTKFLYHLRIEAQVDIVELNNAEVSDYAYERTLMMEQRSEIIKRLNVNRKQSLLLEQEIDGRVMRFRIRKPSTCDFEDTIPLQCQAQSPHSISEHLSILDSAKPTRATDTSNQQEQQQQQGEPAHYDTGSIKDSSAAPNIGVGSSPSNNMMRQPNETNVRRMHTALTLNEAILKRSKNAKLVIINLPGAPKATSTEAENNYMEFIEIITEKLERVLLVQNGGREVITIHS